MSTESLSTLQGYGMGKSSLAMIAAGELSRPKGTWKQYWTRHLLNISPNARLPRGFKQTLKADVSLLIDGDQPAPPRWIDRERSSIVSAVAKLAPAEPVKKPARRKAKPIAPAE